MESYVVRIYRRDPDDSQRLDGMLEAVESEARHAFHGRDELWALLVSDVGSWRKQIGGADSSSEDLE